MTVYVDIYRGFHCKHLQVSFVYKFINGPDEKYKTYASGNNWGAIRHSYGLSVRTSTDRTTSLFITDRQFGAFRTLLKNSIKIISENLYELFPKLGSVEFEINEKALERFKIEKAQSAMNIIIVPALYVSESQETLPGLNIDDSRGGNVTIPLEDAVAMYDVLKSLDPINLSMNILKELQS